MTLDRYPLSSLAGIDRGRQVKLGPTIQDARAQHMMPTWHTTVDETAANLGYKGTIDQYLTASSRFPVTIPEGTRGIVDSVDGETASVLFVWKTPKSNKITAALVRVSAGELVNHRGAPPLPGEPLPGREPSPSVQQPTMFAALTDPTPTKEPATMPTTTPAPAPASTGFDALLNAAIDATVGARVAALEAKLAAALASAEPRTVTHGVSINNAPAVTLSGRPHARMPHVLARMQMTQPDGKRFNLLLTGSAGTGKSTIAKHCAESLGLPFYSKNLSGGTTEGELLGRVAPNLQTGEQVYTPSPLVKMFSEGGVALLDEIDAGDENVLLALNTLLDAQTWDAPDGTTYTRHTNFYVLAGANTFGTGATRIYNGRNQLDGAFLDRWLTVAVDYDTDLERSLVRSPEVLARLHSARKIVAERGMRRWVTTRALLAVDARVSQLGLTVEAAIAEQFEGWTEEDRAAAGLI